MTNPVRIDQERLEVLLMRLRVTRAKNRTERFKICMIVKGVCSEQGHPEWAPDLISKFCARVDLRESEVQQICDYPVTPPPDGVKPIGIATLFWFVKLDKPKFFNTMVRAWSAMDALCGESAIRCADVEMSRPNHAESTTSTRILAF